MKNLLGLRIDVDTAGGFTRGVPPLLRLLENKSAGATFFVIVGQDTPMSGFPRLFSERGFARRIIKLRGSIPGILTPSRSIKESVKALKASGHGLGLHGFHHFRWQLHLKDWGVKRITAEIENARESFRLLTGADAHAFAAPGWETTREFFHAEQEFGFDYASDTRGTCPFYPLVDGKRMRTLQIPVTLPTLDELVALERTEELMGLPVKSGDVYCAHAEFDGMRYLPLFERFLKKWLDKGFAIVPLEEMARQVKAPPESSIDQRSVSGRSRKVAWQKTGGRTK